MDRPESDQGPHASAETWEVAGLLAQPGLDPLLADAREPESLLATPVSRQYLKWRYVDIPGFEYRAVWSMRDEDRAAVIFRYRSRGALRELRLCEVIVGRSRASIHAAAGLIRALLRRSDADYAVAMAASRTTERRALLYSGFLPAPRLGPVLTVRPLSSEARETKPSYGSGWRLSIGDLELF